MDWRQAKLLLTSLLDRIEADPETGKRKLIGVISEKEWDALQVALKSLEHVTVKGPDAIERGENREIKEVIPPIPILSNSRVNKTAMERTEPDDCDVLLCLDFGTARSKAFASQFNGDNTLKYLELGLGARAKEQNLIYPVTSSLWIDENSRIYFGEEAVSRSLQSKAGRKRLDSLKQELSQGLTRDPDEVSLDDDMNPTDIRLSQGDVILLYLSYLTDLAVSELSERYNKSRYISRRFALPCWDKDRRSWGEDILRRYLAKAQIIGDTFHDKWVDGIDIKTAKNVIEEVKSLDTLPLYLIREGVSEPIAAGGSRLRAKDMGSRNLAVVIDIGAGTTDFGIFAVASRDQDAPPKVWPIENGSTAIRQAGNTLDEYLRLDILKKHGIDPGHSDYRRINAALHLRIREYKERLFQNGSLKYTLQNEASGTVDLGSFLESSNILEFNIILHNTFTELLESIHESFVERLAEAGLEIVLTGGGASLPMFKHFSEEPLRVHGRRIKCRQADLIPEEILSNYPRLKDEYPQLAVAMGGATPTLPEEKNPLVEMPGLQRSRWRWLK